MAKAPIFKDRVKLYLTAGNGGDGLSSFRREAHVPRGGPSGGDGGNGANIYLVGNDQEYSLLDLYFRPHHKAESGDKGGIKDCHGKTGKDLIIKVPCGTVITDASNDTLLGEIIEHDQRMLIAKGGVGGLGNKRFMTSTNQAPTEITLGTPGEAINVWLTLKSIAHVGLVGYPNAGKSTLLTAISGARPKVGAYPFTTLNPNIGTVEYPSYERLRVADIPGLIEGAHEGIGLGHDFLRHIERTSYLVYVIDMGGVDGRDPLEDYESLRQELELYQPELLSRPYLIVANKMDVPEAEDNLDRFKKEFHEEPLPMIAALEEGTEPLLKRLYDEVVTTLPKPRPR